MSPPSSKEDVSAESDKDDQSDKNFPHTLDIRDPKQKALYKLYRPEIITPKLRGVELLSMPWYNK
ncbi:hypothetical protein TELCIR_13461, partial [Teladorsagia circumcincta]